MNWIELTALAVVALLSGWAIRSTVRRPAIVDPDEQKRIDNARLDELIRQAKECGEWTRAARLERIRRPIFSDSESPENGDAI